MLLLYHNKLLQTLSQSQELGQRRWEGGGSFGNWYHLLIASYILHVSDIISLALHLIILVLVQLWTNDYILNFGSVFIIQLQAIIILPHSIGTPLPPHSKRAAADVARKQQRRVRQTSIEPNGMDMRINTEALAMAEMLENACDVFLREASRSYLRILEEFGIRP